jgi:outer membrane protein
MKINKILHLTFALFALGSLAFAQQNPAAPPQGTPNAAPQIVPGGVKGKVAAINTAALQEVIYEFKSRRDALNKQFEPRVRDLELLGGQIQSRENTLKAGGDSLTPAKRAELTEQVESLKREYQRKGEDLEADGGRARDIALKPVSEKLDRFAREYAAKKGISVLIDLAGAYNSGNLVWLDPRLDVTEDFVKEFNKANPVPGMAPTTPPATPAKPKQ